MAAATQEINEKDGVHLATQPEESGLSQEESKGSSIEEKARFFGASPDEILEAEEFAQTLSLEDTKNRAESILHFHEDDPNFNTDSIVRFQTFVRHPDLFQNPEKHVELITNAKTEVALFSINSPYAEVRAVVSNKDDPSMPAGTIRAWTIGLLFVVLLSFINQLFSVRQPSIRLDAAVVQLLSFPLGKAWEKWLPVGAFTLWGSQHQLNPGKFNQKEHMLISIMANVATGLPHSRYIVFTSWLEKYFNLPFASSFGFQICLALSMNLMGFGLAGLARRFLVYPAFCIWPRSLVTVALNQSLHNEANTAVPGPFKRLYNISRYKFFLLAFGLMFVWFWFPEHIVSAASLFNWMAWIAPNNFNLTAITGLKKGLGFNPLPTFDWNIVTYNIEPLVVPFHVTFNMFLGALLGGFTIIAMYWTNTYNTGYLPINTNTMFTHNATLYNVTMILDDDGLLDEAKYQAYSPVYIAASSITYYAVISYAIFYHWNDIKLGFSSLYNSFKKDNNRTEHKDVHTRLMEAYREVPEWWYLILNIIAIVLGVASVAGWPTHTSVGVVFFGIALAIIFTIPTGIIFATTGIEVEYNVLAEFIGGAWQPGNALAMNFFKGFGYVTVAHALDFANDLKLGHYLKIPQRQTFWCQTVATIVSAFVCTGVMNFQITSIPNICETDQKDKFSCPGVQTYFTAAVLFGSLGARKVWGSGAQYTAMLAAFPVGLAFPVLYYYATRRLSKTHWLTKIHPVVIFSGGHTWSPYNLGYMWPAVLPAWLSWVWARKRYLAFWSKYNYVLSAAFSTGIAIAAVIIFFTVSYTGADINWIGNDPDSGCEAVACTRLTLPEGEYFGPRIGEFAT
ncbi:OPT oligopeptide transporter protein-domain-containing protein [Dactylonectria estremocensis]|uniref:OPT oligopeptide transporter protein-domain-containing protein n=1 Tax=Dactylonectria estremocensis TaxID=1079267 RepID=A0A9P9IXK7_9HYPO|nr:OPT oligopeptide transporter protein-domain-containing protein [Dactylonectria estremocensis]